MDRYTMNPMEQRKLDEVFGDLARDLRAFYLAPKPVKAYENAHDEYKKIMDKHIPTIRSVIRGWYSLDVYHHADVRCKCHKCHRWMRYSPTAKSPAKRAEVPNAGTCVDCLSKELKTKYSPLPKAPEPPKPTEKPTNEEIINNAKTPIG